MMKLSNYTIGDLVAEFISLCGVKTAFGVISIDNIPILDAIGRQGALRFVMTRGEMGSSHMVDGFARASGELGVVISSTGLGAANTVPGLVEARIAGTPVLHVTGGAATGLADRNMGVAHEPPDQLGMLRATSKAAYRVRSAHEAPGILMRAAVEALTPPMGPVSVEIPIDLQRATIERPAFFDYFALSLPEPRTPFSGELEALLERVVAARRPMLWIGNGARGAGASARKLVDLGFAAVSSLAGRGIIPEDHPMTLGALIGNGYPEIQQFYATCDLMVVVGSRLRAQETGNFAVKLPENLVQIDSDPAANGRSYPNKLFVCGDAAVTLDALLSRIEGRTSIDPGFAAEFKALKGRVQQQLRDTLGPYSDFPRQLREVMPRDALWVRDITIAASTWANRLFPVYGPRDSIYPVGGGIGGGLPLAIGAAIAGGGRKTVLLTGDGGFVFSLTELWTAIQEKLDLTIIVMNDGGYGVIKYIQDVNCEGRHFYTDLITPDLERLAYAAGVDFFRVSRSGDFGAAVAAALKTSAVSIVEIDMAAIGAAPPYHPFVPKRKVD
jgi:acetolactate synthase-1/2/3 large subunit